MMASFGDFDRDGHIDCYLLTYRLFQLAEDFPRLKVDSKTGEFGQKISTVHQEHAGEYDFLDGHLIEMGRQDRLLRNGGDGSFREVTGSAGMGTLRDSSRIFLAYGSLLFSTGVGFIMNLMSHSRSLRWPTSFKSGPVSRPPPTVWQFMQF